MNYFLLANNKNFSQETINKLNLNIDNDILVLFNFLIPLKFNKIRDYPNKICISRKRAIEHRLISEYIPNIKEYYANLGTIKRLQNLFKEIYILPCPDNLDKLSQEYKEHISLYNFDTNKLRCIDYNMNSLNRKLNYERSGIQTEVSTGIIVYEYFKQMKQPSDELFLVAFNSSLDEYHDKDWETEYFQNEISNQQCYAIDSYGICNI